MRRFVIAAAIAAIALSIAPASADPVQSFDGSIKMFTRFALEPESGWPGLARQFREATLPHICDPDLGCHSGPEHDYHQGIMGWIFEVDPDTYGTTFTIDNVADLTGEADVDIFFYYSLGSTVWGEELPSTPPDGEGEFTTREIGGETGTVPHNVTYGIIFTQFGLDTTFSYSAG